MGWAQGDFSEELLTSYKWAQNEAIGRTIICEDGVPRRVVEIVKSMRWPWKMVVNEKDPESNAGHFVTVLSLCAQLLGKPLPSKDSEIAFQKMMRVKFKIGEDGSFDKPPPRQSGIFIPFFGKRHQ